MFPLMYTKESTVLAVGRIRWWRHMYGCWYYLGKWGVRIVSLPSLFLPHISTLTYTHAVFDTDTCSMLQNQIIEADMREEKAVAPN